VFRTADSGVTGVGGSRPVGVAIFGELLNLLIILFSDSLVLLIEILVHGCKVPGLLFALLIDILPRYISGLLLYVIFPPGRQLPTPIPFSIPLTIHRTFGLIWNQRHRV
jgi:hypothetical protein